MGRQHMCPILDDAYQQRESWTTFYCHWQQYQADNRQMINDKIGRFYWMTKNRPIFAWHTTDKIGYKFAEKISRFYRPSVIGFSDLIIMTSLYYSALMRTAKKQNWVLSVTKFSFL